MCVCACSTHAWRLPSPCSDFVRHTWLIVLSSGNLDVQPLEARMRPKDFIVQLPCKTKHLSRKAATCGSFLKTQRYECSVSTVNMRLLAFTQSAVAHLVVRLKSLHVDFTGDLRWGRFHAEGAEVRTFYSTDWTPIQKGARNASRTQGDISPRHPWSQEESKLASLYSGTALYSF